MCSLNRTLLKHINELVNGVKMTKHSKETRKKQSLSATKRWKNMTKAEYKEMCQKISESGAGRIFSREHCGKLSIAMKGNKNGKGMNHTREECKKISKRMMGSKNPMFGKLGKKSHRFGKKAARGAGRGKTGFREDLNHYVRSTWEANIARVFNVLKIKYEYEPEAFPVMINGEQRTYRPDFKLTDENIYIEVKGYMDKYSKQKINAFRNQYPQNKLGVIELNEYSVWLKHFGSLIKVES